MVGNRRGGIQSDLREGFTLGLGFQLTDGVLGRIVGPETVDHAVGATAHHRITDGVGDDEVPRGERHDDEHHENDPTQKIKILEKVVETHLLHRHGVGVATQSRSGIGSRSLLEHKRYPWKSSVNCNCNRYYS
jgi:hypothetical protein